MPEQPPPLSLPPSPLTLGAIGDAYGFCFEFAPADFVGRHNDLQFHPHPGFNTPRAGRYSDDTQMQLALAELLLSGEDWSPLAVADTFVRTFQRDRRRGYARGFYALLNEVGSGEELLDRIKPESERNGAAMRSPVLGLLPDIDDIIERAKVQAGVTHRTRGGEDSAVAAALLSHFFAYRLGAKEQLPEFLAQYVPHHDWHAAWVGPVPIHGISTVRAAVTAILNSNSLAGLLKACIAFTGDVDSVATIACAGASGYGTFAHEIPAPLWTGLEKGRYGRDYLVHRDDQLRRYFLA